MASLQILHKQKKVSHTELVNFWSKQMGIVLNRQTANKVQLATLNLQY